MTSVTKEMFEEVLNTTFEGKGANLQVVEKELNTPTNTKTKKALVFINSENETKFHANYTLDTKEQQENFWSNLLRDFLRCRMNLL